MQSTRGILAAVALLAARGAATPGDGCHGAYTCPGGRIATDTMNRQPSCVISIVATTTPRPIELECDACCTSNHTWVMTPERSGASDTSSRVSFHVNFTRADNAESARPMLTMMAFYGRRYRTVQQIQRVGVGTWTTYYDETVSTSLETEPGVPFKLAFLYSYAEGRSIIGFDTPHGIASTLIVCLMIVGCVGALTRSSWLVTYTHRHGMEPRTRSQYWSWFFCQHRLRSDMEAHKRTLRADELKDEAEADAAIARCRHGSLLELELTAEQLTSVQTESCPVCIDELGAEQQLSMLPCGHVFHRHCVDHWFRYTKAAVRRCPMCKMDTLLSTDTPSEEGPAPGARQDPLSVDAADPADAESARPQSLAATARTIASRELDAAPACDALTGAEDEADVSSSATACSVDERPQCSSGARSPRGSHTARLEHVVVVQHGERSAAASTGAAAAPANAEPSSGAGGSELPACGEGSNSASSFSSHTDHSAAPPQSKPRWRL
ncbi:hypothetical protein KFE25_007172 [Diacronema lutheri]|uniref:RING-type domain-containing protein n=1 Tax=Diacronema lutheri TaxID=2081491 RepID=A0A8J5XUD2_DIALT|nr:hypothetical protein KFE25_007172 [Diacronema lutheri]